MLSLIRGKTDFFATNVTKKENHGLAEALHVDTDSFTQIQL